MGYDQRQITNASLTLVVTMQYAICIIGGLQLTGMIYINETNREGNTKSGINTSVGPKKLT